MYGPINFVFIKVKLNGAGCLGLLSLFLCVCLCLSVFWGLFSTVSWASLG